MCATATKFTVYPFNVSGVWCSPMQSMHNMLTLKPLMLTEAGKDGRTEVRIVPL